jgi:hypothetical protein
MTSKSGENFGEMLLNPKTLNSASKEFRKYLSGDLLFEKSKQKFDLKINRPRWKTTYQNSKS